MIDLHALRRYLLDRAREPSTWRGLITIATCFGAAITPGQETAIIMIGLALAGAVGAAMPD